MASPAAVLSILVEANTSAANASLAKTNAELDAAKVAGTGATTATSKTSSAIRKLGTAAKYGGAALAVGFVAAAKSSVNTTDELTKSTLLLTKNFGLSGKAASEWAGVARARGVDSTKLGMSFKTLATQISAAKDGSAASVDAFKKLGFTQQDITKSMHDSEFAIGKVSQGFADLPPGMDKASLAGKLFGRGWQTIFPILRDGRAAMQDQLDTVEKYGGVLAGKTLKQQEDFLATQRESKIAWQGMQVTLGTALTPALIKVNEQFQKIAAIMSNKKLTDDEKFQRIANIMEKDFSKALDVIVKMIPTIASKVGQQAPKIAAGLVKGFLEADVWGKLLIGTFLISKMGGWGAIAAIGKKIGARIGIGIAAGEAAGAAGGIGVGGAATGGVGAAGAGGGIAALGLGSLVAAPAGGLLAAAILAKQGPERTRSEMEHVSTIMAPLVRGAGVAAGKIHDSVKTMKNDFQALSEDVGTDSKRVYKAMQGMSAKSRDALALWIKTQNQAGNVSDDTETKILKMLTRVGQANQKMWHQASKVTGDSTKKIKDTVGDMAVKVSKDYQGFVEVGSGALTTLARNTDDLLGKLGVKQKVNFVASKASTGPGNFGHHAGLQKGGMMVGGSGSGDKVPAMLEPGEFVMNREAVRGIGAARLQAMNKAIPRFAKGGSVGGLDFALGPYTVPPITYDPDHAGGNSHVHVSAFSVPWLISVGHKIQQMGNSVGEFQPTSAGNPFHFGPITTSAHGHYPNDHYSGHAVDVNSLKGAESQSWVASIANVLKGGAGTTVAEKIARIILKGPKGALRDSGQAALDKAWHEANAFIAKQQPKMFTGKDVGVPTGPVQQMAKALLAKYGWSNQWGAFNALEMSEAGWNPRAVNSSSGAAGLAQALPPSKYPAGAWPYTGPKSAELQLEWMMSYIKDRYGSPAAAWSFHQANNYYKKGGQVMPPYGGNFANGGVVPGPAGAARTIVAHGGERVESKPSRYQITITNWEQGTGYMEEIADGVNNSQRRLNRQMSRTRR